MIASGDTHKKLKKKITNALHIALNESTKQQRQTLLQLVDKLQQVNLRPRV